MGKDENKFMDCVKCKFRFLFEDMGFVIVGQKEELYENFGNAYVDLENKNFKLRFIRDRSQEFIHIASLDYDKWFDLNLVKILLQGGDFRSIVSGRSKNFSK